MRRYLAAAGGIESRDPVRCRRRPRAGGHRRARLLLEELGVPAAANRPPLGAHRRRRGLRDARGHHVRRTRRRRPRRSRRACVPAKRWSGSTAARLPPGPAPPDRARASPSRSAEAEPGRRACACDRFRRARAAGRCRPHRCLPARTARCSAASRRPRSRSRCSPPSTTMPTSASTMPAIARLPVLERAASRALASAPGARASATGNRPTRTASFPPSMRGATHCGGEIGQICREGIGGRYGRGTRKGHEMNAPASEFRPHA